MSPSVEILGQPESRLQASTLTLWHIDKWTEILVHKDTGMIKKLETSTPMPQTVRSYPGSRSTANLAGSRITGKEKFEEIEGEDFLFRSKMIHLKGPIFAILKTFDSNHPTLSHLANHFPLLGLHFLGKDTLISFPDTFIFKTSSIENLLLALIISICLYLVLYKRLVFHSLKLGKNCTTYSQISNKMQFSKTAYFGLLALALAESGVVAQPHGGSQFKHRAVHARGNVERNVKTETETVTKYVTVTSGAYGSSTPTTAAINVSPSESAAKLDGYSSFTSINIPASSTLTTTTLAAPTPATSTSAAASASSSSPAGGYNLGVDPSTGKGVDSNPNTGVEFPDGKLDCDIFPSAYGAIPLSWVTKEGWSGIQINGGNGDAIGRCTEGALCSYACPGGYSKSQWPADQPASGESHGGLLCKGGKLRLTRPSYKTLCQAGEGGVTVRNELSDLVSVCRTDYPGSENMVVPLACEPGSSKPLTVPISEVSYKWQGQPTSAQYYVNKAGVGIEEGCTWGVPNGGRGNWSPMIFGAGMNSGMMWLSISQNQLNSEPLGYNVAIIGGNSVCTYENGVFSTAGGCTTAVKPGQSAYFVLYPFGTSHKAYA